MSAALTLLLVFAASAAMCCLATVVDTRSDASSSTTLSDLNVVIGLGVSACSNVQFTPVGDSSLTQVSIWPWQYSAYTISGSISTQGTVYSTACSIFAASIATGTSSISYVGYDNIEVGPTVFYSTCLSSSGCSVDAISATQVSAYGNVNYNWTLPSPASLSRGQTLIAFNAPSPSTPYAAGTTHLGFLFQNFVNGVGKTVTLDGSSSTTTTIKLASNGGIAVKATPSSSYSLAATYTTPVTYYTYNATTNIVSSGNAYGSSSLANDLYTDTITFVPVPPPGTGVILTTVYSFSGSGVESSAFVVGHSHLALLSVVFSLFVFF